MSSRHVLGWAGIAFLLASSACNRSPEGFCESFVEDTCEAVASCCKGGAKFDVQECRLQLSQTCQQAVDVEGVHQGDVIFDSGAASDCFGEITSCSDINKEIEDTYERTQACANMLTGFRPTGAACNSSEQCEQSGDYSVCYSGFQGNNGGFCAEVVLDEEGCGFSFETNELHVCPDGKFCDTSKFEPNPKDTPSVQAFEFSAKCKSNLGTGAVCVTDDGVVFPCAKGLFCSFEGNTATCQKRQGVGGPCQFGDECQDGLTCDFDGNQQTCQKPETEGLFCFEPEVCGDGNCHGAEDSDNCPADCGGPVCGFEGDPCDFDSDCCGDFCDPGGFCSGGSGCGLDGELCDFDGDCCSDFCNIDGICGDPASCGGSGEFCDFDSDCCSDFCTVDNFCE